MIGWFLFSGLIGFVIGFIIGFHLCNEGAKKLIKDGLVVIPGLVIPGKAKESK